MSKSVLVMDTPESCRSCYLRGFTLNLQYCKAKLGIVAIKDTSVKPDWCPLKPLPEKMKVTGIYNGEYFKAGGKPPSYKIGWNKCIDEITGGEADD